MIRIKRNHPVNNIYLLLLLPFILIPQSEVSQKNEIKQQNWGLVIHGGAGTILKRNMTRQMEQKFQHALREALKTGFTLLKNGHSSVEVVEKTINVLEDSPLFNAGKGAVFTADETNQLDASIMDGKSLACGAVAGVMRIKNPVSLARLVMTDSPHVMLVGQGAEQFAEQKGMELVPAEYFFTEHRFEALQRAKQREKDDSPYRLPSTVAYVKQQHHIGTVGAVAMDRQGNLAAATSTGGMTNKKFNRVGDSPIIGAGTYANNQTCAVSATGHGEYFIRAVVCHDISALMAYRGISLREAATRVIMEKLPELGGTGGIIAIDKDGHIVMIFNTPGMYRGFVKADGNIFTAIYKD